MKTTKNESEEIIWCVRIRLKGVYSNGLNQLRTLVNMMTYTFKLSTVEQYSKGLRSEGEVFLSTVGTEDTCLKLLKLLRKILCFLKVASTLVGNNEIFGRA